MDQLSGQFQPLSRKLVRQVEQELQPSLVHQAIQVNECRGAFVSDFIREDIF